MTAAEDTNHPGHKWAERIINRRHHRDVFALDERDGQFAARKMATAFDRIRNEFSDVDFLMDLPEKTTSIHKIATASDQDGSKIDFPVMDRGKRFSLGERSQILEKLPGTFRIGYIFADVANSEQKHAIAERIRAIYRDA